jgi:hypothetical protein
MSYRGILAGVALALAASVGPTLAQDAATMVCADYAALDNAGKMAVQAELESLNSEMASSQTVTSAEIEAGLNEDCAANPDKLVADAWKAIKGM